MNFAKLLLVLTLVLAACTPVQPEGTSPAAPTTPSSEENTPAPASEGTAESPQESVTEGNLMGTQWILESFGPSGAETAVLGDTPLTLNFSHEGQASGNGGCNSFSTSYQVEDNTLILGEIVSTEMACSDSALMEQEAQYFEALQTVSDIELTNDSLTLTYEQGQLNFSLYAIGTVMATPTAAPEGGTEGQQEPPLAGSLMGTQWILESFGPAGSETPVIGDRPLTLDFSHEGQASGHGGCNSFGTTYQVEEDLLVLGEIISTRMACADSNMMEQEVQYFNALQTASTFELEHDRLTIHYDQGVLNFSIAAIGTVMATPTPAAEGTVESQEEPPAAGSLMGTQWILESYGPPGAETTVIGETPLTLDFSHEGEATGDGGCNSFGTSYQVDGNTLILGEIISTLMACADSDVMEQELQYFEALQTASTFELEHDRLTITYDGGVLNFSLYAIGTVMATPTPAPEGSAPTTATDTTISQRVPTTASRDFVWHCYGCGGNQLWVFEDGQATQTEIPVDIGVYYDYAPESGRILYGSLFPTQGGGPGMVSVTDLWTFDVASGQAEPLIEEEVVVEAEWAADGEQFVYVLATDSTYELRWRMPNGDDKLLASDVAFTFRISPRGDQVAFTRESAYEVGGQPGFYVVDVASGEETMLADFDRAGMGSIEDKPVWSPSGEHLLLPTHGITDSPGLLVAAADGSATSAIQFDPALSGEEWFEMQPFSAMWIDDTHLLGTALLHGPDTPMGGEPTVILYELNDALDTVIAGETVAKGQLVGWDMPGTSVWVLMDNEMQSVPLLGL